MSKKQDLNKSQIVIDSAAYFIMIASALYITTGMIFPSSTTITSQTSSFSKTASSATSKPSAPSSSSWFFSDSDDASTSSNEAAVQPIAAPKTTPNPAPVQVKKQDPPALSKKGPVFSIWSIFANGDEHPDSPPLKERVVVTDQEPGSVFLLENGFEEQVRNVYGSVFVQEEDEEQEEKVTEVKKEAIVVDAPSSSPSPTAPPSFGSSFLDGFFAEEQDGKKDKPSKEEKTAKSSFVVKDDSQDQYQDVVYTWFPSFFAGEQDDDEKVVVQEKVDDLARPEEKVESVLPSTPPSPPQTLKAQNQDPKTRITTTTPENSLLDLLKSYETLLLLEKKRPELELGSQIDRVLKLIKEEARVVDDEVVETKTETEQNVAAEPEPERESTPKAPEFVHPETKVVVEDEQESNLQEWAHTFLLSPRTGIQDPSSPVFVEIMMFLKRQFSVGGGADAVDAGHMHADGKMKREGRDVDGWENVLVQDVHDDSPIERVLVDSPVVKKQQARKEAAAPVKKFQEKKVNPAQAKQAVSFDWDSVLVEDAEDSPIERVLVDSPVVKKQQARKEAAAHVQKVREKQVKPSKPTKPQQKVLDQKVKEAIRKQGVLEFDWESVLVYDGDAHSPLDDILVASKEQQQVKKPATKKASASLVKDEKRVAKSFDWSSVIVEDRDQNEVINRVLATPPTKKTARSSFLPPKVPAAANLKNTRGNDEPKPKQPVQQQQAKVPTASTTKKAAKIDLANLFAFDGDVEDEDVIFAPTPQSTKPKKVRGVNWNIFPQIYKEEKPEEKQKQFINAKKEMERTFEESIKSVKIGKWPSISAKIYPKSSPEALEKSRKEYEDAKKAIARKVQSFGRQIFQLFQ